ncbi:hypothetical protein [Ammoniphilus sp. CFH 90114]|uniref:hypothetical protein n=1 Tax=Ammoniphilus sp. CFH 90114 TaxID=2493665 RepID=UPI00100FD5FF|nr:hypothetical protein [Ammoniphilus sp. CFH 90114]RXT06305.1 hypothetical protein EIZ39_14565 [Ammoniphilus sp. CFH 90114]
MNHKCEICGADHAEPYRSFELESWEIPFNEKKDVHYICFPCFDQLTEKKLQTNEVKERMRYNRENLDKLIEEGLVCPRCKEMILEENHKCYFES